MKTRFAAAAAALILGAGGAAIPAAAASAQTTCLSSFAHLDETVTPGERLTVAWEFLNCGSAPVTLGVEAESITPLAIASPALGWVRWIRPGTLTLDPGADAYAAVRVKVPARAVAGDQYAVNIVGGEIISGTGCVGACVAIGVGGTLELWVS